VHISPKEIDEAVESEETNLNWLEADHSAALINELKPDKAILDCPSPNIKAYAAYIKKRLKVECKIVAEHKADEKYPVVSAASILAKVTRDREKNYQKHPEIFRKSWKSYKALQSKKNQKKLGEF